MIASVYKKLWTKNNQCKRNHIVQKRKRKKDAKLQLLPFNNMGKKFSFRLCACKTISVLENKTEIICIKRCCDKKKDTGKPKPLDRIYHMGKCHYFQKTGEEIKKVMDKIKWPIDK